MRGTLYVRQRRHQPAGGDVDGEHRQRTDADAEAIFHRLPGDEEMVEDLARMAGKLRHACGLEPVRPVGGSPTVGTALALLFIGGAFGKATSGWLGERLGVVGTVPELSDGDTGKAFAVFYTSVICSGGIAPIFYGAVADHSSQTIGVLASAATAAVIVPLVLMLRPYLRKA